MKTLLFAATILAVLLLADALISQRNADALTQRFQSKLTALGIDGSTARCTLDSRWPGAIQTSEGFCGFHSKPEALRENLAHFGGRQTDARVGGPWGKKTDAAGQCWKKLTENDLPPSLACGGSDEDVRVCINPIFFVPSDGTVCVPLSSIGGL